MCFVSFVVTPRHGVGVAVTVGGSVAGGPVGVTVTVGGSVAGGPVGVAVTVGVPLGVGLGGVWQFGKKLLVMILAVCPRVTLPFGR